MVMTNKTQRMTWGFSFRDIFTPIMEPMVLPAASVNASLHHTCPYVMNTAKDSRLNTSVHNTLSALARTRS